MDEDKLREIIKRLDKEAERRGLNEEEKEALYRSGLMPYFSTGEI